MLGLSPVVHWLRAIFAYHGILVETMDSAGFYFSRNMCDRYGKCCLACNVCGGTTIVLYGRSYDLCILGRPCFVDLPGSPAYRAVLAVSWVLPSSCLDHQRSVYLSVLAASAVFTTSRHYSVTVMFRRRSSNNSPELCLDKVLPSAVCLR